MSQSKRILFVIVAIVILLLLMSRGCDRSERSEGCETITLGAKNSIRKTASNAYIDTIKYRKVREMAVRRQKMLEEGIMSASNIISRVSKRLRELDTPAPLSDVCAGYVDPIEDSVFYADGKDFIVLKSESRTVGFLVLYGRKNYRRIHIADLPALMNYEVRNPFPAGYYRATGRYINEHSLQMYKNNSTDDNRLHSPEYKMFCFESISRDEIGKLKMKLKRVIGEQEEKISGFEKLILDMPSWVKEQEQFMDEQRRISTIRKEEEKRLYVIEQKRRATLAQQRLSQIDFSAFADNLHIRIPDENNPLWSVKATLDKLMQLQHENDWLGLLREASRLKGEEVSSNKSTQGNADLTSNLAEYPDAKSIDGLASWLGDIKLYVDVKDSYEIDILCVCPNELTFSSGRCRRESIVLSLKERKYYIRSHDPESVQEEIRIHAKSLKDSLRNEMADPWDFFDEGKREKIIQRIASVGEIKIDRATIRAK